MPLSEQSIALGERVGSAAGSDAMDEEPSDIGGEDGEEGDGTRGTLFGVAGGGGGQGESAFKSDGDCNGRGGGDGDGDEVDSESEEEEHERDCG